MNPWVLLAVFASVYVAGGLFLVGMYVGERRQARRQARHQAEVQRLNQEYFDRETARWELGRDDEADDTTGYTRFGDYR